MIVKINGQFVAVSSPFPTYGFWEPNSGHQAWQQTRSISTAHNILSLGQSKVSQICEYAKMPQLHTFNKCQFMNYILIKIVMKNMFHCLLVTFLVFVIKYLPRSKLRKTGSLWLKCEATCDTASAAVSKLSKVDTAALAVCGVLLLTLRDGYCLAKLLETPF